MMSDEIRASVIAGTWYPGTEEGLREAIEVYFNKVKEHPIEGEILGLISPHAGYQYSGQVAAYGYKHVIKKSYDVVVVVSPLHQMAAGRYLVSSASYYSTPLGNVAIDKTLIETMRSEIDINIIKYDSEHSLEIQLPFLQVALGDFSLLPIMVGHGDVYGCEDLVSILTQILGEKKALLVASTDLHHIPDYDEVRKKDRDVVEALSSFDLERIRDVFSRFDCSVCGRVPVSIVVDTAKRLGADRLEILHHTTSGDVTGDKTPGQYTVGYLSAAIVCK
jgi:AmmeMemoRadiSam system protein B